MTDKLYFPNTLGTTQDGVPVELIVDDIYNTIEFYEHGISLAHLKEIYQEIDIEYHLEMLLRENIIQAKQMTPRCIVYKTKEQDVEKI